ncbi:hypothetical protein [Arthrobacter sp. YD2]|uniref:hypothetical protein n=1 Tax=Arthrobacter sp. YD2 TaxID=3058046 RepID=UPI0025B53DC8|nr:hypothetical protein [Arthrobacter sp. YD2]MDN3904574.1 hypothetical protein [Arthrobacter sp. YD2]
MASDARLPGMLPDSAHPSGTAAGRRRDRRAGRRPGRPADGPGTRLTFAARLPAAAGLVFCGIAAWSVIGNLLSPHYGFSQYPRGWAAAAAGAVLVLMAGLYLLQQRSTGALSRHRGLRNLMRVILWAGLFALQVRLVFAVRLPADWDSHAVFESAAGLAQGTQTALSSYFGINPNNTLLALLLSAYLRFVTALGVTDLEMAAAFLNAVVLFAVTVLTYWAARMLAGTSAAVLALLPLGIFVLFSPWAGVLYSDTVGMVFPILILCLLLAACRSGHWQVRIPLWILAGAAGAVGYGIKPTVLICLVAAGLTALCLLPGRQGTAGLLAGLAVVTGSFLAAYAGISTFERNSAAVPDTDRALPATHFLKVGAQQAPGPHGPYYGSYNQSDAETTVQIADPQERFRHGLDVYAARVQAMGPAGYAGFLNHKLLWITGDGSFFTWGEGTVDGNDFVSDNPADQAIQDFFGNTRPHFPWTLSLWQGTWFLLLALAAVPLALRTPVLLRPELSAVRIALLGLLLFLLLSEARSRFLYLYTPYFILLAVVSFQALGRRFLPARTGQDPARHRGPARTGRAAGRAKYGEGD